MKVGSATRPLKPPKPNKSINSLSLLHDRLVIYSLDHFVWLNRINKVCQHSRSLANQLRCDQPSQWIQKLFPQRNASIELSELIEYYRYYQNTPTIAHPFYIELMSGYYNRTKTLYYQQVKRELQLSSNLSSNEIEKNISQDEGIKNKPSSQTFYVLPLVAQMEGKHGHSDNNTTIHGILVAMQSKAGNCFRGVKDIDKAYQFRTSKQKSQQKEEARSQQKRQLKTSQTHIISTSSFKKTTKKGQPQPLRTNNHKSLFGEETQKSPTRFSKGKKLMVTASCQSIARLDIMPTHQIREKAFVKNTSSKKKRLSSQINIHQKKGHKERSTEKLGEIGKEKSRSSNSKGRKNRSGKKKPQPHNTMCVRAMIDKVKSKIKAEKFIMLKKYGQSRQSYTKSIDSTSGETGKQHLRR